MQSGLRLLLAALAGALLGGALGFLIGGGVVFGRPLLADLWRPEGGFSMLAANGWRVAAASARLFAVPGAAAGAAAALLAFHPGRTDAWGRPRGALGPALLGLVAAVLAAPAGLGLHAASLLGPGEALASRVAVRALVTSALLCGASGLLAGVVLARLAARRARPRRLR